MSSLNLATNAPSHSLEDDIKDFNVKTFELMETYKSPKDKKIYNNKIKVLCRQYRHLLDSPNEIGPKVREFISYNLGA
jgi:hypothetical protein